MTELWYAPARKNDVAPANSLGQYTGGAPKGLLHTTESWTGTKYAYAPALGVYESKGYWPTFTCTVEDGPFVIYQHIPLDRPAKALEHPAGTGETNNDNVVQIEICWGANRAGEMPTSLLDGLRDWMRWVEANHGVARVAPLKFVNGSNRAPWQFWHNTSGWYGHQHAPANQHTDPGPVPIDYLLGGPIPLTEELMLIVSSKTNNYITNGQTKHTLPNDAAIGRWLAAGAKDARGVLSTDDVDHIPLSDA